ncbi:MAG: hypothetical protein C0600_00855 [Ignavibacteria bacterium]|nr:MAG: hypothetical protein C0600_00855 [Ignavibacteria bacterium]
MGCSSHFPKEDGEAGGLADCCADSSADVMTRSKAMMTRSGNKERSLWQLVQQVDRMRAPDFAGILVYNMTGSGEKKGC